MFDTEKRLKIPSNFILLGHKYSVVLLDDLFENESCYGDADEDLKRIRLQTPKKVKRFHEENGKNIESEMEITDNMVIETFFHEVSHIIYDAIGENELSENERLVNMMGKAWLEIYLSSVYEEESK